jgi:hypothetical protein
VLERVGFDRAVERGGIKRILDRMEHDASDIVSSIVFWAVFLIVLQMAFGTFGPNPVSDLIAGIIAYLPKVFAAILIVVILTAAAGFAKGSFRMSSAISATAGRSPTLSRSQSSSLPCSLR